MLVCCHENYQAHNLAKTEKIYTNINFHDAATVDRLRRPPERRSTEDIPESGLVMT